MNKVVTIVRNSTTKVKNHVVRNRVSYGLGVVAVAAIALQQSNKNAFYEFLTSKGIDPTEYYCPEYFEELKS